MLVRGSGRYALLRRAYKCIRKTIKESQTKTFEREYAAHIKGILKGKHRIETETQGAR
jgi:hypothetical protein